MRGLRLLKTTQSGYEGFLHDRFTLLPDTRKRIMASSMTVSWRCEQADLGPYDVCAPLRHGRLQVQQESRWQPGMVVCVRAEKARCDLCDCAVVDF